MKKSVYQSSELYSEIWIKPVLLNWVAIYRFFHALRISVKDSIEINAIQIYKSYWNFLENLLIINIVLCTSIRYRKLNSEIFLKAHHQVRNVLIFFFYDLCDHIKSFMLMYWCLESIFQNKFYLNNEKFTFSFKSHKIVNRSRCKREMK